MDVWVSAKNGSAEFASSIRLGEGCAFRDEGAHLAVLGAGEATLEQSRRELAKDATVARAHLREIEHVRRPVWNTRDAGALTISIPREAMLGLLLGATLSPVPHGCSALPPLWADKAIQRALDTMRLVAALER